MEWDEYFCTLIDNVFDTDRLLIGAVITGFIAVIVNGIGLIIDRWSQSSANDHQGLWIYCTDNNGYKCCHSIGCVETTDASPPEFITATQIFVILGICSILIALFASCVILCTKRKTEHPCSKILMTSGYLFAVLFLLIGVAIYGGRHTVDPITADSHIGVSFILVVISKFICVIPLVLIFIHFKRGSRQVLSNEEKDPLNQ